MSDTIKDWEIVHNETLRKEYRVEPEPYKPVYFHGGFAAGRYSNIEFSVEPDQEGMVQVSVKNGLRIERILRDVFGKSG